MMQLGPTPPQVQPRPGVFLTQFLLAGALPHQLPFSLFSLFPSSSTNFPLSLVSDKTIPARPRCRPHHPGVRDLASACISFPAQPFLPTTRGGLFCPSNVCSPNLQQHLCQAAASRSFVSPIDKNRKEAKTSSSWHPRVVDDAFLKHFSSWRKAASTTSRFPPSQLRQYHSRPATAPQARYPQRDSRPCRKAWATSSLDSYDLDYTCFPATPRPQSIDSSFAICP